MFNTICCPYWKFIFPSKGEAVDIYFVNLNSNSQGLLCFYASLLAMRNCDFSPFYTGLCLFICLFKELGIEQAKSHWLHLFDFSPLCVFKCVLKLPSWEEAKSHWLHLFDFPPLCVFKCVLKLPSQEEAKSHWVHFFYFSPLCIFKCCLKSPAWEEA